MTETIPDIDLEQLVAPFDDTDDGQDHHTHIVNPPANAHIWQPGMDMIELVQLARMNGHELVALCGYRWVPKRNHTKYPVCKPCTNEMNRIMDGASA